MTSITPEHEPQTARSHQPPESGDIETPQALRQLLAAIWLYLRFARAV